MFNLVLVTPMATVWQVKAYYSPYLTDFHAKDYEKKICVCVCVLFFSELNLFLCSINICPSDDIKAPVCFYKTLHPKITTCSSRDVHYIEKVAISPGGSFKHMHISMRNF